ncbi:hypothetical protein M434DRAFT_32382 [Hypoxylon sp. CO27-5]|nr:hypothetical protein M434DRAFT_32382 [Hypoxylon sp. CO27-5]
MPSQRHVFILAFGSPWPPHRVPGATDAKVEPLEGGAGLQELRNVDGGNNAAVLYVTMTAHTPHTTHQAAHRRTQINTMSGQSSASVANLATSTLTPPRPAAARAGVISVQLRRVL